MRTLAKLSWVELKLFVREPITMAFTFAFPLIVLFVMAGVFGNTPDPVIYRGVGPTDAMVPAYIGVVIASIGLIGLPVHLASYRERGVLRRLRASSVSVWSVLVPQVIVSFVIAALGGVLLVTAASLAYDVHMLKSAALLIAAFVLGTLSFAALGVFLGAVLPTARAAQGVGLLLFFVMFILSGGGPPRAVMTRAMQWIGDALPLRYVTMLLQDSWLGFGWNSTAFLIVTGVTVMASLLSVRFFRWE
jgi:ABC-2 type transport system permease protein